MDDRGDALCPICGATLDPKMANVVGLVQCEDCLQWVQPEDPEGE